MDMATAFYIMDEILSSEGYNNSHGITHLQKDCENQEFKQKLTSFYSEELEGKDFDALLQEALQKAKKHEAGVVWRCKNMQ